MVFMKLLSWTGIGILLLALNSSLSWSESLSSSSNIYRISFFNKKKNKSVNVKLTSSACYEGLIRSRRKIIYCYQKLTTLLLLFLGVFSDEEGPKGVSESVTNCFRWFTNIFCLNNFFTNIDLISRIHILAMNCAVTYLWWSQIWVIASVGF